MTGVTGCCACAVSGHAAAPPKNVMNSRRLIPTPDVKADGNASNKAVGRGRPMSALGQ